MTRFQLSLDDYIALFEDLHAGIRTSGRAQDPVGAGESALVLRAALTRLAESSRQFNVPLHMHLLETAYQKEYARRRGGCSAVEYIDRFGLLGPQMTLGHGVWLNEKDIDRLAETGTCVCHNCSSNFRLRSGVAALNGLEAKGVNTAIGHRRSRHQRRSRHAAGDAHGAAGASRPGHGGRACRRGAGVPHGDVRRRQDDARSATRSARSRWARPRTWC